MSMPIGLEHTLALSSLQTVRSARSPKVKLRLSTDVGTKSLKDKSLAKFFTQFRKPAHSSSPSTASNNGFANSTAGPRSDHTRRDSTLSADKVSPLSPASVDTTPISDVSALDHSASSQVAKALPPRPRYEPIPAGASRRDDTIRATSPDISRLIESPNLNKELPPCPIMDVPRSVQSSRSNTMDSTISAPLAAQPPSRRGSTAQLHSKSSMSSVRDASQDPHRSLLGSPQIPQTPNLTGAPNLSGLVCNVHSTSGHEPHPLVGATTTIVGDKLYVFGGRRISKTRPNLTSDLFECDLLRRHWTKLDAKGDIPPPRYFHSVCALGDTKLVCYGGMSPDPVLDQTKVEPQEGQVSVMSDIHVYDIPSRVWTKIVAPESPQGRYAHCAAILPSSAVYTSAASENPEDGSGGAEMVVVGGQDSANHYIEQISIFNMRNLRWTTTEPMTGRSCGAYRSVVTPLTTMTTDEIGAGAAGARPADENDEDDNPTASGAPMLVYTNYNFLDVKLELQVRRVDGSLVDKPMQTAVSPPGLRFPSGGIIDNNFVVAGTFLTSSKQEFSLWSLDLRNLTWARIDTGSTIFSQGSWNRGVLWSRRNAFVILGNRQRNLVEDYNNRRLNFTNLSVIQLEAFGLYDNPRKTLPTTDYVSISTPLSFGAKDVDTTAGGRRLVPSGEHLGELFFSAKELCDMDFLAIDGTRIPVNSRLLAQRWGPFFTRLLRENTVPNDNADARSVAPSLSSRVSSITITPTAQTPSSILSSDLPDSRGLAPTARPRTLYLPHTGHTLQALVHYLYTSSIPPPPSQLATPQVLCSLLQIARPYLIDGLLEAVVERLHDCLDARNAAAIFNATAMGAGDGSGVFGNEGGRSHPPRKASLAGHEGPNPRDTLRIDTSLTNGINGLAQSRTALRTDGTSISGTSIAEEGESIASNSDAEDTKASVHSTSSQDSLYSLNSTTGARTRREDRPVWTGSWSSVIGLQKRGLRGLMEGRRMRERGRSDAGSLATGGLSDGTSQIGLGIA